MTAREENMRARGKWLTGLLAALVFMLFAAIGLTVKVHASAAESDGVVSFDWTGRTLGADETFEIGRAHV